MPLVVKLGAIMGLSSTIIVQMMAQPRVFFAMSRDGLLPAWASTIHPRFRTPHLTTLLTGAIVIVASGFTPIGVLGELVSIGTLVRVRDRLDRSDRVAADASGSRAAVQGRRSCRRLPIASAVVSFLLMLALPVVDVGAADCVDDSGAGDLFRVRENAFEACAERVEDPPLRRGLRDSART